MKLLRSSLPSQAKTGLDMHIHFVMSQSATVRSRLGPIRCLFTSLLPSRDTRTETGLFQPSPPWGGTSYRKCLYVIFFVSFFVFFLSSSSPPHSGAQSERILAALSPVCTPAEVHPLRKATFRLRIQGRRLSLLSGRPDIWREEEGPFDVGGRMEPCLFLWSLCQCKAASLSLISLSLLFSIRLSICLPACLSFLSASFFVSLSPPHVHFPS